MIHLAVSNPEPIYDGAGDRLHDEDVEWLESEAEFWDAINYDFEHDPNGQEQVLILNDMLEIDVNEDDNDNDAAVEPTQAAGLGNALVFGNHGDTNVLNDNSDETSSATCSVSASGSGAGPGTGSCQNVIQEDSSSGVLQDNRGNESENGVTITFHYWNMEDSLESVSDDNINDDFVDYFYEITTPMDSGASVGPGIDIHLNVIQEDSLSRESQKKSQDKSGNGSENSTTKTFGL